MGRTVLQTVALLKLNEPAEESVAATQLHITDKKSAAAAVAAVAENNIRLGLKDATRCSPHFVN